MARLTFSGVAQQRSHDTVRTTTIHAWFRLEPGQAPEGRYTQTIVTVPTPPQGNPEPLDEPWYGGAPPTPPQPKITRSPSAPPGVIPVELESPWWAGAKAFLGELGYQSANMALDEVPYVGEGKAVNEVVTGKDLRGDDLSLVDRAGSAITLIPGGGIAKRALEGLGQVGKGIGKGIGHALDAVRGLSKHGDEGLGAARQAIRQVPQLPVAQLDDLARQADNLEQAPLPRAGFAEPKSGGPLVPRGAKPLGDWGEARLKHLLNRAGDKESYPTSWGWREIDRLVDGIAHESKAGRNVKLNQDIVDQIMKDEELIQDKVIRGAHWHFWQGADPALLEFLNLHGIQYTVH